MPSNERKKLHVPAVLAVVTLVAAATATMSACGEKPQECKDTSGGGSGGGGASDTTEECGGGSEGGSVA